MTRFAASPQVASFLNSKLDFGDVQNTGQKTEAEKRISAMMADASVEKADVEAEAMIEAAKEGAEAQRAQGEAAGQSAMWGGISKGISGIAGGLGGAGGLFGGTNSNGQIGIDRNFSGLTGNQWQGSTSSFLAPSGYTPISSSFW